MSTFFYLPDTDTPTFWETLVEGYSKYESLGPLSATRPGTLCGLESSPTEALSWHHETVNWEVRSIHYFCGGCAQCMGESPTLALKRWVEGVHQPGCQDPCGDAALCDCNNLTRADAWADGWCGCDGYGCARCLF